jgi:hypothetical protein
MQDPNAEQTETRETDISEQSETQQTAISQQTGIWKSGVRIPGGCLQLLAGLGMGCLPLVVFVLLLVFAPSPSTSAEQCSRAESFYGAIPDVSILAWIAVLIYAIITTARGKQRILGITALIMLAGMLLISPLLYMAWLFGSDSFMLCYMR